MAISAGEGMTCGILEDRTVRCWGYNYGAVPVAVPELSRVRKIAVGVTSACAIPEDGSVWCWGSGNSGEAGNGQSEFNFKTPQRVQGLENVQEISGGPSHFCARFDGGRVACWGANGTGQLGDGSTTRQERPVPVQGLSDARQIRAAHYQSCAVVADGSLRCWGRNDVGQLGLGSKNAWGVLSPTVVVGSRQVAEVAPGNGYTCARLEDGSVFCWGNLKFMGLGEELSPLRISGLPPAKQLSSGTLFSCALAVDGKVWCWGNNTHGQLGLGQPGSSNVPRMIPALQRITEISGNGNNTCARREDGAAFCWGGNNFGQLGDGTQEARSAPVPVDVSTSQGAK
jgi:alpha-tubulin suppressor-like RCC1 family protein